MYVLAKKFGNDKISRKDGFSEVPSICRQTDTALGKAQGDHVTAYKSFLEMLLTATEGKSVRKAAGIIANVAKSLLPNNAQKFDDILSSLDAETHEVPFPEEHKERYLGFSEAP